MVIQKIVASQSAITNSLIQLWDASDLIPNAQLDPVWQWDGREGLNEGLTTVQGKKGWRVARTSILEQRK
ncbi:MAG: hypothetical protein HN919_08990 [Verrucomicrobia bacterium]|nr:hypothetical protein [Verrucomicrobiota bacterium]